MKSSKAFTLIELLAVIVLLAIICLISVPFFSNMIETIREKAAVESYNGVLNAVKYNFYSEAVSDLNDIDEKTYICDGEFCYNEYDRYNDRLKISNTIPTSGRITIDSDGIINRVENLVINGYIFNKGVGDLVITKNEYIEVTYDDSVGSGCTSKSVLYGTQYGTLCEPVSLDEGTIFDGWCRQDETNPEICVQVNSDTIVNTLNNHTLTAKWSETKYNLTLEKGTGIDGISVTGCGTGIINGNTITYSCTETALVSLSYITIEGYSFINWNSSDITINNNSFTMPSKNVNVSSSAQFTGPVYLINESSGIEDFAIDIGNGGTATIDSNGITFFTSTNKNASQTKGFRSYMPINIDNNYTYLKVKVVAGTLIRPNAQHFIVSIWTSNSFLYSGTKAGIVNLAANGGTYTASLDISEYRGTSIYVGGYALSDRWGTGYTSEQSGTVLKQLWFE